MPGLLDIPICMVNDDGHFASAQYKLQFPPDLHNSQKLKIPVTTDKLMRPHNYDLDTINGLQHQLGKNLNMRVFREKAVPHLGILPVNEGWRDELLALTQAVFEKDKKEEKIKEASAFFQNLNSNSNLNHTPATGNRTTGSGTVCKSPTMKPKPPSRLGSVRSIRSNSNQNRELISPNTANLKPRTSQYSSETGRIIPQSRTGFKKYSKYDHIIEDGEMESNVLQMLCQILQTDDINAAQSWLVSANDREKALVLEMIKSVVAVNVPKDSNGNGIEHPLIAKPIEGSIIGDDKSDRLLIDSTPTPTKRPASRLKTPATPADKIPKPVEENTISE